MDGLAERVEKVILQRKLLPDGAGAIVGVSGGVDSMVLLHILHTLAKSHRWQLVVAHFNHRLRGKDADEDEQFVRRTANKLGVSFEAAREDVKKLAAAKRISIEMGARQLRHRFLADTARKLALKHVLLAHHADDQVELFFLRLMRGSGTQGLGGMEISAPSPADRDITLLRPMLGIWKSELFGYAKTHRISFRKDTTNDSPDIFRNRIRHKLLPLLRKDFHAQVDQAVLRSMELMRDEGDFVTLEAIKWLRTRKPSATFEQLHVALQRRVMQLELLINGIVPTFDHVEKLRLGANAWLSIGPGVAVRRTVRGKIEPGTIPPARLDNKETVVETENASAAKFGSLSIELNYKAGRKLPARTPRTEFFDAHRVGLRITLRHWRAGDRFQPIGMSHDVKLQDWFVNQKIPRERRHELVIATTGAGEIFWIEGLRIGERFKVTAETKMILQWRWRKETPVAAAKRG